MKKMTGKLSIKEGTETFLFPEDHWAHISAHKKKSNKMTSLICRLKGTYTEKLSNDLIKHIDIYVTKLEELIRMYTFCSDKAEIVTDKTNVNIVHIHASNVLW